MSLEIKDFQATFDRLKEACGVKNQSELAELLDMSKAGISHSVQRDKLPLEWILKAHYKLGVNARYVLDAELPKHVSMRTQHEQQEGGPMTMQAGEAVYVQIPIMDSFLNAEGKFQAVNDNYTAPYLFLSRDRLLAMGSRIDNLVAIKNIDDSESMCIGDDDIVLINKQQCKPQPNAVFMFESDGFCFPRRVNFIKGKFYIENSTGEDQELFYGCEYNCIGRVVMFCHFET